MDTATEKGERHMSRAELNESIANLIPQQELAKRLGVTVKTLISWHRDGINGRTLPKVKIGRRVFYRPDDVDRFTQLCSGGR